MPNDGTGGMEPDRSSSRVAVGEDREAARDRLRVRTAFAITGAWGLAFFGFGRQPPPELSAAFFAATAYLLGTRTPGEKP
jgi:hypothetical protein